MKWTGLFILLVSFLLAGAGYTKNTYAPATVVYDVVTSDTDKVNNILDRASMLQNLYGGNSFDASIIIMIHGDAIPLFSKNNNNEQVLIKRANSLTLGEVIQFRLCRASARMQGFNDKDFYDFITLVPMADAELVKLQHKGYAYLR